MKHKHCELIKAWADGAIIQLKELDGEWYDVHKNNPEWKKGTEYRIKPEPVVLYVNEYKKTGITYSQLCLTVGEAEDRKMENPEKFIRTIKLMEVEDV